MEAADRQSDRGGEKQMFALFTLLVVVSLSLIVTRIATIALAHTGLSWESARFQARSAFSGVGFTTSEAEQVVNHPVRRRIVLWLMLLGNAGLVTAVSSLILGFIHQDEGVSQLSFKFVILGGGLLALWGCSRSPWVDRHLNRLIERALARYTQLDVRDYASLMHLAGEYLVAELKVEPRDWLANKSLRTSGLRAEGVLVLGIRRENGLYLGAPAPETAILPGDTLLLYGRVPALKDLDVRRNDRSGDLQHAEAVVEQQQVRQEELRQDQSREPPPKERGG